MNQNIKLLVLDVDGTMTDGGVYISSSGEEMKKFHVRDGLGIIRLQREGIKVGIISASLNSSIVEQRAKMLKIEHVYVGQRKKAEILSGWLTELGISANEVAYMGDDVNDLDVIELAGLTAAPADAMPQVQEVVDIVLKTNGGNGAVREFIDKYLMADSLHQ